MKRPPWLKQRSSIKIYFSKSIYVSFKIIDSKEKILLIVAWLFGLQHPGLFQEIVVAYGENITYVLVDVESLEPYFKSSKKIVVAKSLLDQITDFCKIKKFTILDEFKGSILLTPIVEHPLYKKHLLLKGEFVDESEGTGFVHIAPSYGEDDFNLAKLHNIEIKDIVYDNGVYKEDTPLFAGIHIFKADQNIIDSLKEENSLVGIREYSHSYPHSWRSKKPVIYRTTPQWFISMEKNNLREKALKGINSTNWMPPSSK